MVGIVRKRVGLASLAYGSLGNGGYRSKRVGLASLAYGSLENGGFRSAALRSTHPTSKKMYLGKGAKS